jgi:hypothetical protein
MKIYILADMEGISGIRRPEQVQSESPEYGPGCKLMMDEMNVAIAAAFEGGATEVVACDTHGGGGQVRVEAMDPRATYEMPNAGLLMPALDASFAGVVLLGHHARAGTLNGFLDHTMNSAAWFEYRINGQVVGEIGIEAAYAGHFDVPVIAVTGDEAAGAEHDVRPARTQDLPAGERRADGEGKRADERERRAALEALDPERVELVARFRNQTRFDAIRRPGERHVHAASGQLLRHCECGQHVSCRPPGCDQAPKLPLHCHAGRC